MAANQVQLRRDTNTNLLAVTPAAGEPGYDTTNKRLIIGDGSKSGGYAVPNSVDIQGQKCTYATTTGSADAQVLTLDTQLQPAAYATGQRFAFIAGYTNTGACTLTVYNLTAKSIKLNQAGTKVNPAAGDITAGRPYDVMYDGTDFVMMNGSAGIAAGAVTNASLEDAAAGNYISAMMINNDKDNATSAVYVKKLEMLVPRDGTYTTRLNLRAYHAAGTLTAQLWVDGSPAGTERTADGYYNEDLVLSAGEALQLYVKCSVGGFFMFNFSYSGNFEVCHAAGQNTTVSLMEAAPLVGAPHYSYQWGATVA